MVDPDRSHQAEVEALVRAYLVRLSRRCAPLLLLLAAVGLVIAFVAPTGSRSPAGLAASPPLVRAPASGTSTTSATSTTAAGTAPGTSSGGTLPTSGLPVTGSALAPSSSTPAAASPGAVASAGAAASPSDLTVSGVTCTPGARQVTWTHYAGPCVPAFHGNNGASTSHGVTAGTITVTYRLSNSGEAAAVNAAAQGAFPSQQAVLSDLETYINYFNKQFELYGRRVVVQTFSGQGDWVEELQDQDLQAAQADAVTAYDDGAFADISQAIDVTTEPYAQDLAAEHVISIGGVVASQAFLQQNAPYVYTVVPTLTDLGNFEGSLVCDRLAGLPAVFSGDAALQSKTRVFGIINPENPDYQSTGQIVQNDLQACGATIAKHVTYSINVPTLATQDTSIVAQMKAAGVTTIICGICDDISQLFLTEAASEQDYHPELVTTDDGDAYGQLYSQDVYKSALGPGEGLGVVSQSEAYKVFQLADPGGQPAELSRLAAVYGVAIQLFDALQAAGPDLTPSTFEAGEFSLPTSLPGGDLGTWSFGSDVFSPETDYPLAWYDPNATSTLNGKQGAWVTCAGSDGAFRPWTPAGAYGPAHTQLHCFNK